MRPSLVSILSADDFNGDLKDLIDYLVNLQFHHNDTPLEIKVVWDFSENDGDFPIFEIHKKI